VIVPAYQACDTISRTLSSIAKQTVAPREVIVIDDGSTDGTAVEARKALALFEETKLIVVEQPNRGAGAARNHGVHLARSELLAFLDADDEWLPTKIEKTLPHLDDPDIALVGHDYTRVQGSIEQAVKCSALFQSAADTYAELYRRGRFGARGWGI